MPVGGAAGVFWAKFGPAAGWFIGGLFASEVVWGAMTAEEIQPIIDGLAFDEALLGGLIGGVLVVLVTRFVTGGTPFHRPVAA